MNACVSWANEPCVSRASRAVFVFWCNAKLAMLCVRENQGDRERERKIETEREVFVSLLGSQVTIQPFDSVTDVASVDARVDERAKSR